MLHSRFLNGRKLPYTFADLISFVQAELGKEAYNAAWERGKSLDLETVVKELLDELKAEE